MPLFILPTITQIPMTTQFLGLQKLHNHSILYVCNDCAIECDDKIVRHINFTTRSDRS